MIFLIMTFLIGRKIGMTQIFNDQGYALPVTLIKVGPCKIRSVREPQKDGYAALQISFTDSSQKTLKEFRVDKDALDKFKKNQILSIDDFKTGDLVKVTGISKAKGFQGVVKRHGFKGASATHGTKHAHRQPGSIGQSWPQKVFKGRKMAGRAGGEKVTVSNLKIVKVDSENSILAVKGATPGWNGSILLIKKR